VLKRQISGQERTPSGGVKGELAIDEEGEMVALVASSHGGGGIPDTHNPIAVREGK
jgi:hypothetical protein